MDKEKYEWPYKGARDVCWYCGGQLCWDSDTNYDEVFGEGEGIVSYLHCNKCGAMVMYSIRDDIEDDPAKKLFRQDMMYHGTYLFDDGTIGYIADPEFNIEDFIDGDYDSDLLNSEDTEKREAYVKSLFDGKIPIGNIYIDRYDRDGEFYQGGCFLYYEGETLGDYCDRNGEPRPVREIPEEAYELLEEGTDGYLEKVIELVPE